MDVGQLLLDSVKKNVNVPGLANDLLDNILEPALKNIVAQSKSPLDDVLMAALYPVLEAELKRLAAEYWGKLLSPGGDIV